MKSFEERYIEWMDGTLPESDREVFERDLPDLAAARKEREGWEKLRGTLREVVEPVVMPHADFVNARVLEAIQREEQAADRKREATAGARGGILFPIRRLVFSGAFTLVLAAVAAWWVMGNLAGPSEEEFISQVIDARANDPALSAYVFAAPGGRGTVLWIENPGYIPATERIR